MMLHRTIKLSSFGISLGSRDIGEEVRKVLIHSIEHHHQPVEISFEGVFSISSSFADECFGKLVESIGKQQFKECFLITGLQNGFLKSVLNNSVNKRLHQNKFN